MSLRRLLATVIVVALKVSQTVGIMESSYCARPGDQLTFECTVNGGIATVWHGRAFDCGWGYEEIAIRHSLYSSEREVSGTCNNGDILARSVGVVNNNHFISQVNVTVSSDMHNKTIECDREDADGTRVTLRMFRTLVTTEVIFDGSLLVPNTVHLANVSQGGVLTFEWLDTGSLVYPTDYVILSNCGTCPLFTSNTSVTCQADLSRQSLVCQFAVLTQVCGRVYGNPSPQFLSVMLRVQVPGVPELYISYIYNHDDYYFVTVYSTIIYDKSQFFNISDGIDGSPTSYTIIYSDAIIGAICLEDTLPASECEEGVCHHYFDAYRSECSPLGSVSVSACATNILGDGPVSDPVRIILRPTTASLPVSSDIGLIIIVVVVPSTALGLCATAIVCTVVIVKVKQKKRAGRAVRRNQETGACAAAVTYEEIGEVQQSSGRIDTTKNVAYCHI